MVASMRMKLPDALAAGFNVEPKTAFHVLMVYEDLAAGKRAMDTCKFLMAQVEEEIKFRTSMWKFGILQNPKLGELAVGDALEADVIIVAARGQQELPPQVKAWMETWVPQKRGQAVALIAILARPAETEGPSPVQAYLKQVAAGAQIDFLLQEIQTTEGQESSQGFSPGAKTWPLRSVAADYPASENWGLNE